MIGDWGDLDEEDKKENELSVKEGFRILSAYELETSVKVWVSWGLEITTNLLPRPEGQASGCQSTGF